MQAQSPPTISGCQVFPANNVWNTRVDSLPVLANSATLVATVGASAPAHPDFGNASTNGIPITTVSGSQAFVKTTFAYASESDPGPYPVPADALVEGGSGATGDRHVLVVDSGNCTLYELYNASLNSDGSWKASAGAVFPLNSNQLRPAGWTSADAAGLPVMPGLVRYDEVASGHIDHALRFTAPQTQSAYIWPARHEASYLSGAQYPPMGTRFRLKASFDISPYPAPVQVILTALKQYGMILADNGAPWFISGTPDSRWDDSIMHYLTNVVGSNFEAVDESSLQLSANSAQAKQPASTANIPTNTWVRIVNANSGKCLDVYGGPSATQAFDHLNQWDCWGGTNQAFELTPVSGGYKITAENSGLQLDVLGGPSAKQDGTEVIQYPYWGGSNEIWNVTPTSDGYFQFTVASTGQCLDVAGQSTSDGAFVDQWPCWGGQNQKWSFRSN